MTSADHFLLLDEGERDQSSQSDTHDSKSVSRKSSEPTLTAFQLCFSPKRRRFSSLQGRNESCSERLNVGDPRFRAPRSSHFASFEGAKVRRGNGFCSWERAAAACVSSFTFATNGANDFFSSVSARLSFPPSAAVEPATHLST